MIRLVVCTCGPVPTLALEGEDGGPVVLRVDQVEDLVRELRAAAERLASGAAECPKDVPS